MQLALTVLDPATRVERDVLAELDEATTVGELAVALGRLARPDGVRVLGSGTAVPRLLLDSGPLDPTLLVRDSALREGSVVGLDAAPTSRQEPQGLLDLCVVGGPHAGRVHRLGPGEARVGDDPDAEVRLAGLGTHACTVRVTLDGASVEPGPARLSLDGEDVDGEVPWPDGAVLRIGETLLALRTALPADAAVERAPDGVWLDYNRPPRLLPPLRRTTFELPSPPTPPRLRGLPWLAVLAPVVMAGVLVLVLGSLRYALFAAMSPVMALGNYVTSRTGARKQYREDLATYTARREAVEADAEQALQDERRSRRAQAPDPAEALLLASGPRGRLWERRREDPDYLVLRVGTAPLPSEVVLRDPEQPAHKREVTWTVPDAPVTVSLAERGVIGLAGRRALTAPLVTWMAAQVAVLHSPRDVRLYVLTDGAHRADWEWVRWLPHCRPEQRRSAAVLLGTDTGSLGQRLAELQAELQARWAARSSAAAGVPAEESDVVVVLDGARRLRALPGVVQLLKEGPRLGVHVLCVDTDERLLPEECAAVVTQSGPHTVTVRQQRAEVVEDAAADLVPPAWCERVARALAPLRDVADEAEAAAIPDSCRLLDVIGMPDPDVDGVLAGWAAGGRTTEAVLGVSLDGPFALDLRRDGPHALVAGTTGAGKSELLQTLVASLALANRPDAMTFVLVDYKGGSAFKDCALLPHTVGMVTDLDTHLVERALTSLGAELHRREHLLAAAGAKDIEDYTDLTASRPELSALPRLALVIDEFASLARELPDFVKGLVNIAQRGRSLGIHLVLATQRPTGVVSPEIRANTNLRIALRVTDKAESTDVLDAPDAALIAKSTPGRAYVRLGHSSLVPFQAGRVGGRRPVRAGGPVQAHPAPWLVPLEWARLGAPVPGRPRATEREGDVEDTDLAALVTAVRKADAALGLPPQHSPWLPALPASLTTDDLPVADGATPDLPAVPFGLADVPARQEQRAETVDLATLGHKYVIGAARSGRTQALRTLAGALADAVPVRDLHLYGLDCGSGGLLALTALPHCGAVVQRTQVDRVSRLLQRLVALVATRQEVLAASGFTGITEQRAAAAPDERLPHVVLLLDRWEGFQAALSELDGGALQAAMMTLLNEGAGVGVHCVVAGDRSLSSYRTAAITEDKLVLRLADRADYSAVGLNARTLPDVVPDGRGFTPDGLEVQVALLPGAPTGQGQAAALAAIGERAAAREPGLPRALRPFRLDVLPTTVDWPTAAAGVRGTPPPLWALLGLGGDDLEALGPDLARTPSFLVAGPPRSGRSSALAAMSRWLVQAGVPVVAVAPRPSPLRELDGLHGLLTGERLTPEDLEPLLAFDGPLVLVLDDAELHKDTPAADLLKAYLRSAADRSQAMLVGGSATDLAAGYTGWHAEARKGRAGALLSPQGLSDGELVGVNRLPRSLVGQPVAPGRALLHLGDGSLVAVTVPRPA